MIKIDNIFLYTNYIPLQIKESKYSLILFGNPGKIWTHDDSQKWIDDIIKGLTDNAYDKLAFLKDKLQNTRGLFLFIFISGPITIIASDHVRSYPLFYGYHHDKCFITDNLQKFQNHFGPLRIDFDRIEEFLSFGLIYNNRTIYKDVFGLQAAEIVSISEGEIRSDRYFIFKPSDKPKKYINISEFSNAFNELFLLSFSRLVEQNKNVNNWIIPLSGGHDSRLIVNYLYRLGVRNVICYSYGEQGNEQAVISRKVAEQLGYRWHFIEYTKEKWKFLFDSGIFGKYIDFAFNGISTPHLQDFLAVYELREKGILKEGDIFLPGHTVVTVSVFNEETLKLKNLNEALSYVYSKVKIMAGKYNSEPPLYNQLRKIYHELNASPENFMAICDWQERQSKYITNSIKVYEFFGYQSRQPMWDKELVNFWLSIPARERTSREPLYKAERRGVLSKELLRIPYAREPKVTLRIIISRFVKMVLPAYIYIRILRLLKIRAYFNEGLNHIYESVADSVEELLDPIEDFPPDVLPYFREYLERSPCQMDPNRLTTLYTVRRLINNAGIPELNSAEISKHFRG